MDKQSRILITGASGMVGSRLVEIMKKQGYVNLLTPSKNEMNLFNMEQVSQWMYKVDYVIHLAALVGGIEMNMKYPVNLFANNIRTTLNVMDCACFANVKKLLFMGSSCVYPVGYKYSLDESYVMAGSPEYTNEGYALAKISGMKLCGYYRHQYGSNFISIVPSNIYGKVSPEPIQKNHVISALIKKILEAKKNKCESITLLGTGEAKREFIYVDDVCDAILFMMENYDGIGHINIGTGQVISIKELAEMLMTIINYECEIIYDTKKPDGSMFKCMDVYKASKLGWNAKTALYDGLKKMYKDFISD